MADQQGPNLHALGLLDGGNKQAAEKPKDMSDFINGLFEQFSKWASKLNPVVSVKLDSLLNTGLFANVDVSKAGLQVNKQIMPQSPLSMPGGTFVNAIADGVQIASVRDFSRIERPPIEGIPIQAGENRSGADYFTPAIDHGLPAIAMGNRGQDRDAGAAIG